MREKTDERGRRENVKGGGVKGNAFSELTFGWPEYFGWFSLPHLVPLSSMSFDPLSFSARVPPAGSDADPMLWAPTTTSGRRGPVLYYGFVFSVPGIAN